MQFQYIEFQSISSELLSLKEFNMRVFRQDTFFGGSGLINLSSHHKKTALWCKILDRRQNKTTRRKTLRLNLWPCSFFNIQISIKTLTHDHSRFCSELPINRDLWFNEWLYRMNSQPEIIIVIEIRSKVILPTLKTVNVGIVSSKFFHNNIRRYDIHFTYAV